MMSHPLLLVLLVLLVLLPTARRCRRPERRLGATTLRGSRCRATTPKTRRWLLRGRRGWPGRRSSRGRLCAG
jgi:hypothetical protein